MSNISNKPKRLVFCALLCAIALTIFVVEAQLPTLIPIPGVKLGLSNIVTLFALLYLTRREVFVILIGRILLGAFFSGNPSTLIYSLSGGIVCLLFEIILIKFFGKKFIVEISVVGAMFHNTVQILCSYFVTQSISVFWYLPPLLIAAVITGAFCGLCVLGIDKRFGSAIINHIIK